MKYTESCEITQLDEIQKMDIIELKTQIEENQLIYGINKDLETIYIPKDPDFFKMKRKLKLERLLNDLEKPGLRIVADSIKSEIESCDKFEYRDKGMIWLTNEYFKNRIKMLVNMKRSQMLRYKRYCINKTLTEFIKVDYEKRLKAIDEEYLDMKVRYSRLKSAEEGYICKTDQGLDEITADDMLLYMKWLIFHLFSLEYITSILKVIRWVPIKYRKKYSTKRENDTDSNSKSEKTSKHNRSSIETYSVQGAERILYARPSEKISSGFLITTSTTASGGGGVAVDERNLLIPLHTNDLQYIEHLLIYFCSIYEVDMDVKKVRNSSDEMELYNIVSRRFKTIFSIQEQMRTFKVYDKIDVGHERWGMDSSTHALLKPANWLSYNSFKPKIDLMETNYLMQLRSDNILDEFLITASLFVKKSNAEETQTNLRHNALIIQHLPVVYNTAVESNPKGFDIADIFKTIYTKSDMNLRTFKSEDNTQESSIEEDRYNFTEALQMLGLDECSEAKDDPSTVQGAYLSYLHLRFLKIRDLQRTCLSVLNYFRSVERTLVIDRNMISKSRVKTPKRVTDILKVNGNDVPRSENIGNHGYLQSSVEDFKMSEAELMNLAEIDNHDDYYLHEYGRVHVQDTLGNWIIYDIALKDFDKMESDLNLIGSYYIYSDKDLRLASLFNRKQSQTEHNEDNEFYISEYGHREVDRYGVLYDLWSHHTEFMERKKKLVDLYMEVYNSIYDEDDKKRMAQMIINTIHRKPRLDIKCKYFVISYRLENTILKREFEILKMILDKEILRIREYLKSNYRNSDEPFRLIPKLQIAVNSDESALSNLYFLEFIPSLSCAYQIHGIIQYSLLNLRQHYENESVINMLKRDLGLMDMIITEINLFEKNIKKLYVKDIQSIMDPSFILCNPVIMEEIAKQYIKNIDNRNTRGEKKTRKTKMINEFCRIIEIINLRFRFVHSIHESEYLHHIYDNQANTLGYSNFHLFMKLVPFEAARKTEGIENYKPPLYISSVQDDDSLIEKYRPKESEPIIRELDNVHFGKMDLNSPTDVIKCLEGKGVENFQLMLKTQLVHKNAVSVAVLMCENCRPSTYDMLREMNGQESESCGERGSINVNIPLSSTVGPIPLALDSSRANVHVLNDTYPEAFFSIQLEKIPIRDKMMNAFLKKYPNPKNVSQPEMEKAKRDGINFYLNLFCERITNAALKSQIISYYNSIIDMLKLVPQITTEFFQFGKSFNFTPVMIDVTCSTENDPRVLKTKCHKVIDNEGKKLINIWYLPHFSEILFMHRQTDDKVAIPILYNYLRLVMGFHDIIQYIVGIWRLSFDSMRVTEKLKSEIYNSHNMNVDINCQNLVHPLHNDQNFRINYFNDYENSNDHQLRKELIDLDVQIQNIKEVNNLEPVIELFDIKKKFFYLYFEICVTILLKEVFISTNQIEAYRKLDQSTTSAIPIIKNMSLQINHSYGFNIPSFIWPNDPDICNIYPWRVSLLETGPLIVSFDSVLIPSESIQLCFVCIPKHLRNVIYKQFCHLNLVLEDIIVDHFKSNQVPPPEKNDDFILISKKMQRREKKENFQSSSFDKTSAESQLNDGVKNLSIRQSPIETYKYFIDYLRDLKSLYLLKYQYGCRKANVKDITNLEVFVSITKNYKTSILFPVLRKLSHSLALPHIYFYGPMDENDIIVYPTGVSEITINKLLITELLEELEKYEIKTLRAKIIRQIDQVIKQRHAETATSNPSYQIYKNSITQPNLVTDLIHKLEAPFYKENVEDSEEDENEENVENKNVKQKGKDLTITFKKKWINGCLQYLSISLMRVHREFYESFAMYFENLLKHQYQLLRQRNRELSILKVSFIENEQSSSVAKQFILAKKASDHIIEINYLRGKMKSKKNDDKNKDSETKKFYSNSYKYLVRNIYSLAFEQRVRMRISILTFHGDVYHRINEIRVNAWVELNKVKEKIGSVYTTDDELASRNIVSSRMIKEATLENIFMEQFFIRMKSLINWIYAHTMSDNDYMITEMVTKCNKLKGVVYLTSIDAEQKVKLIKFELKRLKVNLNTTNKELTDLKSTLNKEKNPHVTKGKGGNRKLKTSIRDKKKQINDLLSRLKVMNCNIGTMSMKLESNMRNNESVAFKSHKEVERLSKILASERLKKLEAFHRVDDLVSTVYEFEAGFAIVKTAENSTKPKKQFGNATGAKNVKSGIPNAHSEPLKSQNRLNYSDIINRHCIPYTQSHFLPFRRNRVEIQKLKNKIYNQIHKDDHLNSRNLLLPKLRKQSSFVKNMRN